MMITLFHGSNVAIDEIDLSKGLRDKDFGKGFYLTVALRLVNVENVRANFPAFFFAIFRNIRIFAPCWP